MRVELTTTALARQCSTTELHPRGERGRILLVTSVVTSPSRPSFEKVFDDESRRIGGSDSFFPGSRSLLQFVMGRVSLPAAVFSAHEQLFRHLERLHAVDHGRRPRPFDGCPFSRMFDDRSRRTSDANNDQSALGRPNSRSGGSICGCARRTFGSEFVDELAVGSCRARRHPR